MSRLVKFTKAFAMKFPSPMPTEDRTQHALQWLSGIAVVDDGAVLPTMACASKSALRAVGAGNGVEGSPAADLVPRGRPGLRLIFNDDHGMTPSVTIVNQTGDTVLLRAVRPAILATDNGTYDLGALLAGGPRTIEPGCPLVIRITDIGRNVGEPFRVGAVPRTSERRAPQVDGEHPGDDPRFIRR